ncbi:nitroreductase family deazaflavin-dependent oxidoreductase [Streptomyces lavendulae]|uniref:nitroreductase family deazaflavin-dependent oxidoreductase n=1 Tax=Streptomyces lavendulae TaxID=1914 RepID=UPI0033E12EB4
MNVTVPAQHALVSRVVNGIMPSRWGCLVMRALVVPVDTMLHLSSGGRLGMGRPLGIPSLLLTTTGARSGLQRSTPLCYVHHADGYAVIGSNFGLAHHPAWSTNLLENPGATVVTEGSEVPVTSRLVIGGEREEIWAKFLSLSTGYQTYRDRCARTFRIFHLKAAPPIPNPRAADCQCQSPSPPSTEGPAG